MSNAETPVPAGQEPLFTLPSTPAPEMPERDERLNSPKEPLLHFDLADNEETRTLILGLIDDDLAERARTEEAIMQVLYDHFLPYAKEQAVKVKQGKL